MISHQLYSQLYAFISCCHVSPLFFCSLSPLPLVSLLSFLSYVSICRVLILHLKRFCPLTLTKQHQALTLDPILDLRTLGER